MDRTHFASLYPADSRFEEIEMILQYARVGNSSQLIGLPGVGKSNLLELLAYNRNVRIRHLDDKQTSYHFVLVNFSEVRNRPLTDVMKFIFLELIDSLEERDMDEAYQTVSGIFKDSLSYQDEMVLFQGLKKSMDYLTQKKELSIILLFDRFESFIPSADHEFFSYLKILRNRAKYKFSVVFCLNRPLEDTLDSSIFADYYELVAGHTIYMKLLDEPGLAFRIEYLEKAANKKLDKNSLNRILELTAGHGKLTRLCIEIALATTEPTITPEFLLSQKSVRGALWEIWYFLSPSEQKLFLDGLKEKHYASNQFLENIGLIKEQHITLALFEVFIGQELPRTQSTEKIVFDVTTNTIQKGTITLSDRLTISEFRLLAFLIAHPEAVVDREQIIEAVWRDNKQTVGVTDQAIDQLIFRLRKKIEDDPNTPLHIQTVKGRGIKFTP